jgi:hypothetical protein
MFWSKKIKNLGSEEYLTLYKLLEALRIQFETLKLDLDLHKKKLRVRANIDKEEEESTFGEDLTLNTRRKFGL